MPALRTTLVAVGIGAATLTTGALVATSATAAPAPVAAVERLAAPATAGASDATGAASDRTASDRTASDRSASDGAARTRARGWWKGLTDTQRTCLQSQGITRPVGPLDGTERAALRAEVEAAATTCDVELPFARARAFWDGLTDGQRTCLEAAGVNRPWGPLTKEQRQAVRADLEAAADTCGVTLPTPRLG
ncbi:MAG TPA: hypothetical protein VFI44_09185 [Ornithinibacter sp.]|nr:hypothetical protein [Ornithinibacter sp.]